MTKQRRDHAALVLVGGFIFLLFTAAYLVAASAPTVFHFTIVALHAVVGVLVTMVGVWAWAKRGLPQEWVIRLFGVVAAAGAVLGLALLVTGATSPYEGIVTGHASLMVAAAILFAVVAFTRRGPALRLNRRFVAPALIAAAAAGFVATVVAATAPSDRADRYAITNPDSPPLTMEQEGGGPGSPFFPSSARTNVGGIIPANFFLTSAQCGRCHTDIYAQWNESAHHFSSFNNQWYRKSIEYMQDVVGTQPSKWCAGCHDPAVFFNGRFDRPIKDQINTPEAQAGLGCLSCHAVTHVGSTMGQGDFTVEYPPLHDLAASENPVLAKLHDVLLYLDPKPHREMFLKPFHTEQTAEFCSSCHKVHLDRPVNDYRWFRGFNDYDAWQASGVSGMGARSFYYPAKPQHCGDCHMPLVASKDPGARNGQIHSHRFVGANTALPFVNGHSDQLKMTQDFLKSGVISVDVFGIARTADRNIPIAGSAAPVGREAQIASTFADGEESSDFGAVPIALTPAADVLAPLDKVPVAVRRGESVVAEVVIRTRRVGHFFPGGTVDAFDVWVEFEAVDDKGQVLLHSGMAAEGGKGPVDKGAHFYRSVQLDARGNPINKRNAWSSRSVAYVRLIPPGAADTVHYRIDIPEDAGDRIYLRAKVNYRKFAWWNTQWAYAGVRDPANPNPAVTGAYDDGGWVFTGDTSGVSGGTKAIPDLPVTVMASAESSVAVLAKGAPLPRVTPLLDRSVRERWNDYGIGLLLQGDLRGAEEAFLKVTRMDPGYADGFVNVARVRVQEGNIAEAEPMLRTALEIDAKLGSAHYFLGLVLKAKGMYPEALAALQRSAALYPQDRVVRNQIARVLFLERRFTEAISEAQRVLAIDPEDLQAHYTLMLSYRASGNDALATREQTLYERFKADEGSQAITGAYRLRSPEDNNERQQIHEHQ